MFEVRSSSSQFVQILDNLAPGHSKLASGMSEQVMQAGRWKSTRKPMRHGGDLLATRGGMARAAAVQGRDDQRQASRVW
jgi:hypothetical protein